MTSPLVIGMVAMDMIAKSTELLQLGASNIGSVVLSAGGVAHNMATNLQYLGSHPKFISVVADDSAGDFLIHKMQSTGLETEAILQEKESKTASYHATHDSNGELHVSINDMSIIQLLSFEKIQPLLETYIGTTSMLVFDANLTVECISGLCQFAAKHNKPTWFNPTSVFKAQKIVYAKVLPLITFMSPNIRELQVLAQAIDPKADTIDVVACVKLLLAGGVKHIVLTQGEKGVTLFNQSNQIQFPALPVEIVNVTGAGDALASGMIHVITQSSCKGDTCNDEQTLHKAIQFGLQCAQCALQSEFAVNPNIKQLTSS